MPPEIDPKKGARIGTSSEGLAVCRWCGLKIEVRRVGLLNRHPSRFHNADCPGSGEAALLERPMDSGKSV